MQPIFVEFRNLSKTEKVSITIVENTNHVFFYMGFGVTKGSQPRQKLKRMPFLFHFVTIDDCSVEHLLVQTM
jgi:hypothetical protein